MVNASSFRVLGYAFMVLLIVLFATFLLIETNKAHAQSSFNLIPDGQYPGEAYGYEFDLWYEYHGSLRTDSTGLDYFHDNGSTGEGTQVLFAYQNNIPDTSTSFPLDTLYLVTTAMPDVNNEASYLNYDWHNGDGNVTSETIFSPIYKSFSHDGVIVNIYRFDIPDEHQYLVGYLSFSSDIGADEHRFYAVSNDPLWSQVSSSENLQQMVNEGTLPGVGEISIGDVALDAVDLNTRKFPRGKC